MKQDAIRCIIRGMNQDTSISKANNEYSFENKNIRIIDNKENQSLSISNEKGNLLLPNTTFKGNILGQAIFNDKAVLFSKGDLDRIYIFDGKELKLYYEGNLNFSNKIEAEIFYETDSVEKVYWVDGSNPLRGFNLNSPAPNNPDYFNISTTLSNKPTVEIKRLNDVGGKIHSGIVQYYFTYSYKHWKESNIVYESDLYQVLDINGRAGSSEETLNTCFKIKVTNLDTDADFLNIYMVHRSTKDTEPVVYKISELPVENTIEFIDYGTNYESIDPTYLLSLVRGGFIPNTLSIVKNTLFLANIDTVDTIPSADLIAKLKRWFNTGIGFVFKEKKLYPKDEQKNLPISEITGLMPNEHYGIAIQLRDKLGAYTLPIPLGVIQVPSEEVLYDYIPNPLTDIAPFTSYRVLIHYPKEGERKVIANGLVSPTLFLNADRKDKVPYIQPSWNYRADYYTKADDYAVDEFKHLGALNRLVKTKDGNIPYLETLSALDKDSVANYSYIVDRDYVTINSPDIIDAYDLDVDIEFSPNILVNDTTEKISVTMDENTTLSADINGNSIYKPYKLKEGDTRITLPSFTTKVVLDKQTLSSNKTYYQRDITPIPSLNKVETSAKLSTWYRDSILQRIKGKNYKGNIDRVIPIPKSGTIDVSSSYYRMYGLASPYINTYKVLAGPVEVKYKAETHYIAKLNKTLPIYTPVDREVNVLGNDFKSSVFFYRGFKQEGNNVRIYFLVKIPIKHLVDDNLYTSYVLVSNTLKTSLTKSSILQVSSKEEMRGIFKLTSYIDDIALPSITANGFDYDIGTTKDVLLNENSFGFVLKSNITIDNVNKDNQDLYLQNIGWQPSEEIVNDVLTALSKAVVRIKANELPIDYETQYLFRAFIKSKVNTLDISNVEWDVYSDFANSGEQINRVYGDTFYQDTLLIKTFATGNLNKVSDAIEVPLFTRINQLGRYDKNINVKEYSNIGETNYNLINPVYSQISTIFKYRDIDSWKINNTKFINQVMWSNTKINGEAIDRFTKYSPLASHYIDGINGSITRLNRLNDRLIVIQENAIGEIIVNPRVQVSTSDGIPIELKSSSFVDGHRYILEGIGCKNKWSIVNSINNIYFVDYNKSVLYSIGSDINSPSLKEGMSSYFAKYKEPALWYDYTEGKVYIDNKENTLVYNEFLNAFESFYSYSDLSSYFNIGDRVFTTKNSINNIWEQWKGEYNTFYGVVDSWYIHYKVNPNGDLFDKIFTDLEFRTDSTIGSRLVNTSVNTLSVWNEYQSNLNYPLKYRYNAYTNTKEKFRIWRIQIPRDSKNKLDRFRNPWLNIKLISDRTKLEKQTKDVLHDLTIYYYV